MNQIRCFLIVPTDRVRSELIVSRCACENCRAKHPGLVACAAGDRHRGISSFETVEPFDPAGTGQLHLLLSTEDETLPWPTHCSACGLAIPPARHDRATSSVRLWENPATHEISEGPYRAGVGAMYRANWLRGHWTSQDDGDPLVVNTPGTYWYLDSQASNCGLPDDKHQDRHHCWTRRGAPPNIDVTKHYGPTCVAGAGSFQGGGWHGFLRNGWLDERG